MVHYNLCKLLCKSNFSIFNLTISEGALTYLTVKKVKGRYYAYKQASYREGGQVRTRTVEYLGAVDSALGKQIRKTKSKVESVAMESLIKSTQEDNPTDLQHEINSLKLPTSVSDSPPTNDQQGITKNLSEKVTTREKKIDSPKKGLKKSQSKSYHYKFPCKNLTIPNDIDHYGLSRTALERTYLRFGERLLALNIESFTMPKIAIEYGHPESLKRNRNGSYTVIVSRRTQNKYNPIKKIELWKHYRQALCSAYLDAIGTHNPELYHQLSMTLDKNHQACKSLLFECLRYATDPFNRLLLSLQLLFWNNIPPIMRKHNKAEDFGQIDFSTVNNWQAETVMILSEVQKLGWQGLKDRQKKARNKQHSLINRYKIQLEQAGFFGALIQKISGKKRRYIREIMQAEAKLKAIDHLAERIIVIQSHLNF